MWEIVRNHPLPRTNYTQDTYIANVNLSEKEKGQVFLYRQQSFCSDVNERGATTLPLSYTVVIDLVENLTDKFW